MRESEAGSERPRSVEADVWAVRPDAIVVCAVQGGQRAVRRRRGWR